MMPLITGARRPMPKSYRAAYAADRALYNRVGADRYNEIQEERVDYYRSLIRQVSDRNGKVNP
jgi:hypothetical protein